MRFVRETDRVSGIVHKSKSWSLIERICMLMLSPASETKRVGEGLTSYIIFFSFVFSFI